jgi:hypothetical protein
MRYNIDYITTNIVDHLMMYKRMGVTPTVICPDKAETGHYTIKIMNIGSYTTWDLDRSIHRNKIMRRLSKDFPELLPLCRNQRINELGI